MPYVNIKVTREGGPEGDGPSEEEKALLIAGVTELLRDVLGKDPRTTFVVIDETPLQNWGVGGLPVEKFRQTAS
ncbi:MAG: 4-oxalocrotonate tautomerase family protein [Rhodobacteraceae bacterium]|nr:4-oxalocrotonate tautomerase family protein [Paracoccaceae bacterium]